MLLQASKDLAYNGCCNGLRGLSHTLDTHPSTHQKRKKIEDVTSGASGEAMHCCIVHSVVQKRLAVSLRNGGVDKHRETMCAALKQASLDM